MPQLGAGGGMPRPRKESDASDNTAPAIPSDAWTISGWMAFGSICVKSIRILPAPEGLCRQDKIVFADLQYLPAHHACVTDPADHAQRKDQFAEPCTEKCDQCNREQQAGKREKNVKDITRQKFIDPPAIKSGDRADQYSDNAGDGHDRDADLERNAGTKDDTGKNIAAESVGAEPMLGRRRRKTDRKVLAVDVVRGEKRRKYRDEYDTAAIANRCTSSRFITNLRQPYPRIEPPVNDVRQRIRDNIGHADDQNAALNKAVIALCRCRLPAAAVRGPAS